MIRDIADFAGIERVAVDADRQKCDRKEKRADEIVRFTAAEKDRAADGDHDAGADAVCRLC